jgi:hypothetical protein
LILSDRFKAIRRFNNIRRLRRLTQIKSINKKKKLKAGGSMLKAILRLHQLSADYADYTDLINIKTMLEAFRAESSKTKS